MAYGSGDSNATELSEFVPILANLGPEIQDDCQLECRSRKCIGALRFAACTLKVNQKKIFEDFGRNNLFVWRLDLQPIGESLSRNAGISTPNPHHTCSQSHRVI